MTDIDKFYDKAFGKESALFLGTLWLGMIAKQMDEVRKANKEAYQEMDEMSLRWLNELRTLYDSIEFKTDIPRYKGDIEFTVLTYNPTTMHYEEKIETIPKKNKFLYWFEKIEKLIESLTKYNKGKKIKLLG